jgi:hypothetical protein
MDKRVIDLVEKYPSDMELGASIRKQYWDYKAQLEEYKDVKIFESPDGGKTVYQRPFGGDISQRKLVTSDEN